MHICTLRIVWVLNSKEKLTARRVFPRLPSTKPPFQNFLTVQEGRFDNFSCGQWSLGQLEVGQEMGRKLSKSPHLLIGPLMEDDGGSPRNCLTAFESIVCTNHGHTRWAPASYKWSYNPYKWPYKWLTVLITLVIGVINPVITGRGSTLYSLNSFSLLISGAKKNISALSFFLVKAFMGKVLDGKDPTIFAACKLTTRQT